MFNHHMYMCSSLKCADNSDKVTEMILLTTHTYNHKIENKAVYMHVPWDILPHPGDPG